MADAHEFADTFLATARHLASLDGPGAVFPDPEQLWARGIDGTQSSDLRRSLLNAFDGRPENGSTPAERTVIAVFDTDRGRIVSVATPSVTGERWTSIAPGDRNRVSAALRQLAHTLPGGV